MNNSPLNNKSILIVDDEPDVLQVFEDEVQASCPGCTVDKAMTYEKGAELLQSKDYAAVVLDIMGIRGFDLLQIAVSRKFKTAMLTSHALSPEALKKSHDLGARAYLPKDKLGEVVPFLEDMLSTNYDDSWANILDSLEGYFDARFRPGWKQQMGVDYW